MGKNAPRDVLAARYASDEMVAIWGTVNKVVLERRLWIAALKAQKEAGLKISDQAIADYERVATLVNLDSINEREKKLKHDVKARIEEFNALSGHQLVHQGFTSRDLTDNIEQMQIVLSLHLVKERSVAVLARFVDKAQQYADVDMCARTHNVPAQVTTLGKRFANFGEEFLAAYRRLEHLVKDYHIRGIKGAVGTQQDMIDLLGGADAAHDFETSLGIEAEWPRTLGSVGQVYPRSLDFEVVSALVQLSAAPSNFALMVRLMAGSELMHEGFGAEQAGSSAMPHKMNSRTCERINGLVKVLRGYELMVSQLAGDQWFEGDVSCSVVRRVALQGAFFALDGLYESTLTVLDEMQIFPAMIHKELMHYLPLLSTSKILMQAIKDGMGREDAHKEIKERAVGGINRYRQGANVNFFSELTLGTNFPTEPGILQKLITQADHGAAPQQVAWLYKRTNHIIEKNAAAAVYQPAKIV
ncbi:adenylosuccinate lyase [Candidatus Kaiserbacteria bacterium]|nr:adenylosuccinate lyase [Candidatus Kaiserbacteria bacterium]